MYSYEDVVDSGNDKATTKAKERVTILASVSSSNSQPRRKAMTRVSRHRCAPSIFGLSDGPCTPLFRGFLNFVHVGRRQ